MHETGIFLLEANGREKHGVLPLAEIRAKARCFTHHCFCAIAARVSTVGNGVHVAGETSRLRTAILTEPFLCVRQTLRASTCPKSTRSPSSPWTECLSWSSRRRGNSKGCYTSGPLHPWRCPLPRGRPVRAQGPFWQGREQSVPVITVGTAVGRVSLPVSSVLQTSGWGFRTINTILNWYRFLAPNAQVKSSHSGIQTALATAEWDGT